MFSKCQGYVRSNAYERVKLVRVLTNAMRMIPRIQTLLPTRYGQNNRKPNSSVCVLTLVLISQLSELERSLSNSLLNLEASNAELEKFKLERAQLQAQLESVSDLFFITTVEFRTSTLFSFLFPEK